LVVNAGVGIGVSVLMEAVYTVGARVIGAAVLAETGFEVGATFVVGAGYCDYWSKCYISSWFSN